ncbi:hypothetical protein F7C95_10325 [Opitutia bacterium ISCC 51]|nr:hypothetical protein F7C95_10325 [Opitutae bacterium ISCC 51]QXD26443.1 hypothetical protein GA003_10270 [Opitutae bacterium ISCC 52]
MDVYYVGTNSSTRDNFTISKGSYFKTQTEVDNFSVTHGTGAVNGNLTILDDDDESDPIVDLDGLSALNYVGGDFIIENNAALASFCGLYPLYDTGSIDGNSFISGNIANPTTADILARGLCETYEDYYDWMASFYLDATSQ